MDIKTLLKPEAIIIPFIAANNDEALSKLVEKYIDVYDTCDFATLIKELKRRETVAPTLLSNGIAVPHARCDEILDTHLVIGVSPLGMPENKTGKENLIKIFCLFFSPTHENSFGEHLKILSLLSSIFSDASFVDELCSIESPNIFLSRLESKEKELED